MSEPATGVEKVRDVSAEVMRRVRRHLLSTRMMGVAAFLFICGTVMSRGGARGGPGAVIARAGTFLFLAAIAYGLVSTLVGLRCPSCGTRFGQVVSSLYAPIGVPDDYAPSCSGCGANLLPPGERARAKVRFWRMLVVMAALPVVAAVAGWGLSRI